MIPPIPKRLFVHSAELVTKYSADKWGNATASDTVKMEHIRIDPSSKVVTDSTGTNIQLSAVLFYDCRNSSPAVTFALKGDAIGEKAVDIQQVIFGGRTFTVQIIEPLYADSNKIHHYEVGLI